MNHSTQNNGDSGIPPKNESKNINISFWRPQSQLIETFLYVGLFIGLYHLLLKSYFIELYQLLLKFYSFWILSNYFIIIIKYWYGILYFKHERQFGKHEQFDDKQQGKQHQYVIFLYLPDKYQLIIIGLAPTTICLRLRFKTDPTQLQQPWRIFSYALLDQKYFLQQFCLTAFVQSCNSKQLSNYIVSLITGSDELSFVLIDKSLNKFLSVGIHLIQASIHLIQINMNDMDLVKPHHDNIFTHKSNIIKKNKENTPHNFQMVSYRKGLIPTTTVSINSVTDRFHNAIQLLNNYFTIHNSNKIDISVEWFKRWDFFMIFLLYLHGHWMYVINNTNFWIFICIFMQKLIWDKYNF